VGGWLLTPFLQKIGHAAAGALRKRVADELNTTFASGYSKQISLAQVLQADAIGAFSKRATGTKYLINPSLV
jgi:NADPH2:quinone reductase